MLVYGDAFSWRGGGLTRIARFELDRGCQSSYDRDVKAYRIVALVIDHEEYGLSEAIGCIENERYVSPTVMEAQEVDIGEWSDDHPLNCFATMREACARAFKDAPTIYP